MFSRCLCQAKAFSLPYIDVVLRIFRDLISRDPAWSTISLWVFSRFFVH